MGDEAYWEVVRHTIAELESAVPNSQLCEKIAGWALHHSEWPIRAACLRLLAEQYSPDANAVSTIAAGTHDPVDWVAFTSIKLVEKYKLWSAVEDLIKISGWPSNFTKASHSRKPVGCGAALTKRALVTIFGTRDPGQLRRLEDDHFAGYYAALESFRRYRRNDDVILIPGGQFQAGAEARATLGPFKLTENDNPPRTVYLDAFYIDRLAVTNARYRGFLVETTGMADYDHPDQQPGKSHVPAHWHAAQFNRDENPVVGIDWYDAWAFARWAGGRLPSEEQWEKAARGTDGRIYPWGNFFDSNAVNYVERSCGQTVTNISELDDVLTAIDWKGDPPRINCRGKSIEPLLPADALPEGVSPYGVLQMSGNVWEITRTNFYSHDDMDPFFKGRRPVEFMNRKDAFHVLRGGAWTSPPPCLATHYRGRDLLTDAHNEVGFRCVYDLSERSE